MKEEGGRVLRISDTQEGVCSKQLVQPSLSPLTAALDPQWRCVGLGAELGVLNAFLVE